MEHLDDIRLVAAFVAVADLLHVGRAAATLGVSRSTASDRLGALERRLDLVLVDRSHRRRIALTPEGEAMLPVARDAIAAREAMEVAAAEMRDAMAAVTDEGRRAMEAAATEVRDGRRGVVRVAVLGPRRGGSVGDAAVRELGAAGEQLADALSDVEDGWRVEFRAMDRRSAYRAMAVGGLECAIGAGGPLRRPPDAYDPRPNRLERTRSVGIRPRRGLATTVTWRSSWAAADGDHVTGGSRVRDRLVGTARQLAARAFDQRFPARAAARDAVAERRRAADAARARLEEDTRRFGRTIALRRARAAERRAVIARYEAARAAGSVPPSLLVEWMVAMRGDDPAPPEPPRME